MGILLFNWLGYRLVFDYLQRHAEIEVLSKIELKDFQEDELLELRVDLQLPYYNNWKEFEPYYGEVEIDGRFYTFVKRKIEQGQLVLKCLPNYRKESIRASENHLFKVANGLNDDPSKPLSPLAKLLKSMLFDIDVNKPIYQFEMAFIAIERTFIFYQSFPRSGHVLICEQPPDNC